MSNNDRLIETIEHYKRNIIRACPETEKLTDPKKVVYCLEKLSKLPISVELLSVTGIGRTVNELRKFEGAISEKAKILVTTWKAVVKAEEDKKPSASDWADAAEVREVNGNHNHDAESSASDNDDNTSEEDDDDKEDVRDAPHSNDEHLDKENTQEEDDKEDQEERDSEEESEDERQRRLKFEEEKKAYEEYLKAKRKKALNGHAAKNGDSEKRRHADENGRERRKSSEKRDHKKADERRKETEKENSKEKHASDSRSRHEESREREKQRSSSDSKSSRDKRETKNGERSRSSDNHKDKYISRDSKSNCENSRANSENSKSNSKDRKANSKSNSNEIYSEEIRIKQEKIDDGYEYGKEADRKDKLKNGECRQKSSKDERSSREDKSKDRRSRDDKSKSSARSSSAKRGDDKDRDKDQSKRKHEGSESGSKRAKAEVVVKQEPVTSDDDSRSSSAREDSSSRESSVSASAPSVKKEKSEYSSQREKHNGRDSGRAAGATEPKKMKLIEASDGGFADALMSIVPTKKSPKKKSSSRKASEQKSPAGKSSRSSSPRHRSTTRSPSVHSSGSISPLDLLSGNVKLEPLEKLDIASTLPEISPDNYYKPHLFQSPGDRTASQTSSHDDLCNIMTSKNQRTKVFSGSRVTLAKVPSLYDSCIRILQENIDSLEYTGGVPYDILKPVLERCTAEQLYQLEHYNPYLMEDTGSHWEFHCGRDFRGKRLQEYETWRELYLRCMLEREKKLKEVKNTIALSKKQSIPVRTTKLAYVDSSFVKPPRQVARQQAKHGTGGGSSSSGQVVSMPNKAEVVAKASVGAYSSSAVLGSAAAVPVAPVRPGNSGVSAAAANNPLLKKKKAPLMMKALQSFKGIRKR